MKKRRPVSSSVISAVGYDPVRRVLEVEFHNGSVYSYDGVEPLVFEQFLGAPSKGRYFNRWIADRYPFDRLD
ncbi:KTSC domain-containing protein [Amycolatopsis acidicola]|uniref:KTSC domain-containing protein n=1 Tax=Amycolatopsis acidicola TaxID=2596893 RepID=A0A5N0V8U2_9PSEU|nr:KTSC domain-containing protein [Amycolatopsis acidicola]KAA9161653.1 KTSC domain-containing protein [Amycolatopsis acidicola]